MKLIGYKINGYLVLLALIFITIISGSTGCGCLKCSAKEAFANIIETGKHTFLTNNKNLYEAVHLNQKLRQSSVELSQNDFIRKHVIHNKNNYKNCPCSQKQLGLLYTRGGNSQPQNIF